MQIKNKAEILSVLNMPEDIFFEEIVPEAQKTFEATKGRNLTVTAMLGYDNICKNQCLYCGMRAGNHTISLLSDVCTGCNFCRYRGIGCRISSDVFDFWRRS